MEAKKKITQLIEQDIEDLNGLIKNEFIDKELAVNLACVVSKNLQEHLELFLKHF